MLLAAGAITISLHPFFPMSSRWMERSFTDTMHETLTFVWLPFVIVAVALSAVVFRGWFRIYSVGTLLLMTGFGIEQNDTPWAGAFERVNAYALMVWFALLAVTVLRRCFTEAAEERTTDVRQTRVQRREPSLAGRS